jgi:hypothetical protein
VVYYKDKEVLKYLIRNVSEKIVKDENKRKMFLNCLLDCAKSKVVETLPGLYKGLKDSSVSNRTIAVMGLCVLANNGVNRTLEGLLFALKDSKLTNASQSDIWRALKSLAKNGNTKAQRVLMNKGLTWWRD